MKKIVIIGAGPAGLGAAWQLNKAGYKNWQIFEKNNYIGGLSASFTDRSGFTWDNGGHVIFSENRAYLNLCRKMLGGNFNTIKRRSYIQIFDRQIGYPFQNNLRQLPRKIRKECAAVPPKAKPAANFSEWIINSLGSGIAKHFMLPYNRKVWVYPLEKMGFFWTDKRISPVKHKEGSNWGQNRSFIFPRNGGIGELFDCFLPILKNNLSAGCKVRSIEPQKVILENGEAVKYDLLINTSPLDAFIENFEGAPEKIKRSASALKHNSLCVVGIGLKKSFDQNCCWVYFPEGQFPFYRITYFSNYSAALVPGYGCASLLCEISFRGAPPGSDQIIKKTVRALIKSSIIDKEDKIISTYYRCEPYSFPIPTLDRDRDLKQIFDYLKNYSIISCGRFGGWKYEVGNMDHSFLQGAYAAKRAMYD